MIYFFVFGLLVMLANLSVRNGTKHESLMVAFSCSICAFIGLRVDAGYDYGSYVQVLENGYYFFSFEPIPLALGLVSVFLDLPQLFFFLTAVVQTISIHQLINNEKARGIYIALFFSLPFCLLDSFSLVRQFLAASLFIIAYTAWVKHRLLSILIFFCGVFSHKTAPYAGIIFVFLFYFNSVFVKKYTKFFLFLPLLIAPIVYFSFPLLDTFKDSDSSGEFGLKGAFLWLLISIPFIINSRRYFFKYTDPIALISVVGLGIYFGLSLYGYFISRYFVYFTPFAALFLARSFHLHFGNKAIFPAIVIGLVNISLLLFGASKNSQFDFLNNYKLYPAECMNCNIRPDGDL